MRYFATIDGKDIEVDSPEPFEHGGDLISPLSRTFITSRITANPYLLNTGYMATLQGMPEPLRSQMLYGDFDAGMEDDADQAIPTDWVLSAMKRWAKEKPTTSAGDFIPMCAISLDAARGGPDNNVITMRYDNYFDKQIIIPGIDTPIGEDCGGKLMSTRRNNATVIIDCGGGYGDPAFKTAKAMLEQEGGVGQLIAYVGSESCDDRAQGGGFGFTNVRSAAYWKFREALDPSQPGGSDVALPDDQELLADLTAPRFGERSGKIFIEPKDKLKKRLGGRSTDKGDGIVMANWRGLKQMNIKGGWPHYKSRQSVQVNLSGRTRFSGGRKGW